MVPSAIIVLVIVPVSPVVITVPVTLGNVIVLSAVGLVTVKVVSFASSEDPSNTIDPEVNTLIVVELIVPVTGPANAVAVIVPTTSNSVEIFVVVLLLTL
jgi:hypothetical protein